MDSKALNVVKRLSSQPVNLKAKKILQELKAPSPVDSLPLLELLAWGLEHLPLDVDMKEKLQTVHDRVNERLQAGQVQQAWELLTGTHNGEAQISVSTLSAKTPQASADKLAQAVVGLAVM